MRTKSEQMGALFYLSRAAGAFRAAVRYGPAIVMALCGGAVFAAQPVTSVGDAAPIVSAEAQNSAQTLKIKAFSAQGMGFLNSNALNTCFGELCNASQDVCLCSVYSGTVKAPILGQSTWTVSYTVNASNDVTPTGNGGYCFPGEGELVISNTKGAIVTEVSGPECTNYLSGASTTFIFQYGQAFKIDPTLSTGAAAGLNGGGSFSLSEDVNHGDVATMTANGFSIK